MLEVSVSSTPKRLLPVLVTPVNPGTSMWDQQLHHAISSNDTAAVQKLLEEHEADIDLNGYQCGLTPLCLACKLGRLPICELLLRTGSVDINKADQQKETPVLIAIKNRDCGLLRMLLDHGADPNQPEPCGNIATPLYNAVWKGQTDMVQLLIEKGCDLNKGSARLYSPLIMAARTGNIEVARRLIEAGCERNIQNKFGVTPLYEAVLRGNEAMVKFLAGLDCDVNIADEYGVTPLYLAIKVQDISMVQLLLDAGADILKQSHGDTPATVAAFSHKQNVLQLLLHKAAELNVMPHRQDLLMSTLSRPCYPSYMDNPHVETADTLIRAHSVHKVTLESDMVSTLRTFSHLGVLLVLSGIVSPLALPTVDNLSRRDHQGFLVALRKQPLRLSDLTRIVVRKLLGLRTLYGVVRLPIPQSLQDFLLFQDDNDLYNFNSVEML